MRGGKFGVFSKQKDGEVWQVVIDFEETAEEDDDG
jgi:hypothetical protein